VLSDFFAGIAADCYLFPMLYVGKRFTSVATGRRIVEVDCETCQTKFYYELVRQGRGVGVAPYYIGQGSAQRRATEKAQLNLATRLKKESDLVACPQCQWVNESLIHGYRRTRFKALPIVGVIVGVALWFVVFLTLCGDDTASQEAANSYTTGMFWASLAAVAAGGIFFAIQLGLRRRINPNRLYPQPPRLPPATPKGWTAEELAAPRTSEGSQPNPDAAHFPDWAVVRAGHLIIPSVCCQCLGASTTVYKPVFTVDSGSDRLRIPLCVPCGRRIRWRWWGAALETAVGAAIAGALVYLIVPADQVGRMIAGSIVALFGLVIAAAIIPNNKVSPYKLRTVDRARSIFRIKFRNEQFTEMVRVASAKSENAALRPDVETFRGGVESFQGPV
jgi:hypothetical protein